MPSGALRLSDQTMARVRALFSSEEQGAAIRLLEEDCGSNLPFCESATSESAERIRFAALKLSRGNLGELRSIVDHAKIDWRDVLVWAGFGDDVEAHRGWWPA
jgi:hypothetical protein